MYLMWYVFCLCLMLLTINSFSNHDMLLKAAMLKDYNQIARPSSQKMNIHFNMDFMGVVSVELMSSKITLKVSLQQSWKDERLRWIPADYGGMKSSVFTTHGNKQIWVPELSLKQSDGESLFPNLDQSAAQVYYDGTVVWNRPGNIDLIHKFVLRDFPFEIQEVDIMVEIHAYPIQFMELLQWKKETKVYEHKVVAEKLANIVDNIQWEIKKIKDNTLIVSNVYGDKEFSALGYKIWLKRKGMSTINVMYLPAIMVSFLSIFSYFIPIDQVVRIQFTTTLLLTLIMLLLMVTRFLPITSEEPLIQQIFVGLVAMVFSCDLFVVMIAFYKKRYDEKMTKVSETVKPQENTENPRALQKKGTKLNLNINIEDLTNMQIKNQEDNGTVESLVSISQSSEEEEESVKKQSVVVSLPDKDLEVDQDSKCKRLALFLARPYVIDQLFFLFITIIFIVFFFFYYIQILHLIHKQT